jgi:predicted transcriptional regulator
MKTVLYSVKPEYADLILDGSKTVELRKRAPSLKPKDCVLIYASSPRKMLVGLIEIVDIISEQIETLWDNVSDRACIDLDDFQDYYRGKTIGIGIGLGRVVRFRNPVSLDDLREQWPGFTPPQDYRYVTLDLKDSRVFERRYETVQPVAFDVCKSNSYLIRI